MQTSLFLSSSASSDGRLGLLRLVVANLTSVAPLIILWQAI
jgi:hypothetical protein